MNWFSVILNWRKCDRDTSESARMLLWNGLNSYLEVPTVLDMIDVIYMYIYI